MSDTKRRVLVVSILSLLAAAGEAAAMQGVPAPGSWAGLRPVISASYWDAQGIDPATAQMWVDGTEVTADATVTVSSISYQPAEDLAEKEHSVTVRVANTGGESRQVTWTFSVDVSPPEVKLEVVGCPGRVMKNQNPTLKCSLKDAGSGVDPASIQVMLDETEDVTALVEPSAGGFTWKVPEALTLSEGLHRLTVQLSDNAENTVPGRLNLLVELTPPEKLALEWQALGWFALTPAEAATFRLESDVLVDHRGVDPLGEDERVVTFESPIGDFPFVYRIWAGKVRVRLTGGEASVTSLVTKGYDLVTRGSYGWNTFRAPFGVALEDFIQQLAAEPEVERARPSYGYTEQGDTTGIPNDPHFGLQWGLFNIDARTQWKAGKTGRVETREAGR